MAYATLAQLRIAAGGSAALAEISDSEDAAVLAFAQASADAWIDGVTRRLNSAAIPWNTTDAPQIAFLAAAETVYILRCQKRVEGANDIEAHKDRQTTVEAIAAGKVMPSTADTYPVGDGGGGPVSGTRTLTSDDKADGQNDRSTLVGLW